MSRDLEQVVAAVGLGSRLELQLTDGSNVYAPQRTAAAVTVASVDRRVPLVRSQPLR